MDLGLSPALDSLVRELGELGAATLPLAGDMATVDAPGRVVDEAVARFGGLDGVSNAGVNRPGPLAQYAVEDWDRMFAVNTRATWLLAKAGHDALAASRGAIVAVASMSGSNAHANLGPYGPSKAALIMLVAVLAQEFGRDGVRVNSLSPGMVRTGMTEKVYQIRRSRRGATRWCRSGAWPRRRIWRTSSRSCSAPTRATSTATISSWMAASPATSWPAAGHLADHEKLALSAG